MLKQSLNYIDKKLAKLLANTGDMALKRRARRIIEELNPGDGDKILDVGCGDGYYLHLLSNLGLKLKLTGIDSDPNALKSAKKNLRHKKVRLIEVDLMKKLPFPSNYFDKAVMSEVAEHLPDDIRGLREVFRVLKPGGILCLSVPNANYPFLWDPVNWTLEHLFGTHIKSGFWAGIWNQHIRLYKPLQIQKVAEKAGFKILGLESLTFWCLPFNHNLVHLVARGLYGGGFSKHVTESISKYKTHPKKPFLISLAFGFANAIDRLNDIYQPKRKGVGVFVKARR